MKETAAKILALCMALRVPAETAITLCPFGMAVYEDRGNGALEAFDQIGEGTRLEMEGGGIVRLSMISKATGQLHENIGFYKVRRDGRACYVPAAGVGVGERISLIAEDAALFESPRLSAFSRRTIPKGTPVVAGKAEEFARHAFTEIQYFDEALGIVRRRFVLRGRISDAGADAGIGAEK